MQVNKSELVSLRGPTMEDKNFIFSTWLRGLRFGNDWFELIESDAYYSTYHKALENILSRPDTKVVVACLKEDQDVILGYSVHAGPRLDWVFVKKAWRGIGIAKSLIPLGIKSVSHITRAGRSILKKYPDITFNPFV